MSLVLGILLGFSLFGNILAIVGMALMIYNKKQETGEIIFLTAEVRQSYFPSELYISFV